jgi:hypothetical protein
LIEKLEKVFMNFIWLLKKSGSSIRTNCNFIKPQNHKTI